MPSISALASHIEKGSHWEEWEKSLTAIKILPPSFEGFFPQTQSRLQAIKKRSHKRKVRIASQIVVGIKTDIITAF